MRVGALHDWPVLFMQCSTPRLTALASASLKMILAPLPPNSNVTRFRLSAAALEIAVPARVEPVKDTISTSGWFDSWVPTPAPSPLTRLNTPSGKPAASTASAKIIAFRGDSSDGLSTIVQPAIAAAATLRLIWFIGQFHGVISAQTPTGS